MARILQNENLLVVYSKRFLHFEWKLEETNFESGTSLRSGEFNLGGEKTSFLEFEVDIHEYLYLNNPEPAAYGRQVLTIFDKNNVCIYNLIKSLDDLKMERFDLLGHLNLTPDTAYPITVSCTIRSSNASLSEELYNAVDEISVKELSSDMKKVLEEGLNTDVVLSTEGDDIKAHKFMLQARSPVFRRMFNHDSIEAANNSVDISDISLSTMKRLVTFLYTGRMEKCNFDEAMELYYAADKYEVLSLLEACKVELMNNLDIKNAGSLFTLVNRHSDEDFKEKVVQFLSANFEAVLNAEPVLKMNNGDIGLLVRMCAIAKRK
nr:BTB/POZ domain-containing protein At5g48510-like [Parasteatoda tepidariorum]